MRLAGAVVALQGLAGVAFAVAVLISAFGAPAGRAQNAGNLYGEAGFFLVMALAVVAVAGGLLLGHRWSRTPAAVIQVLLVLVACYALGPSALVVPAIATAVLCVATLVLLFTAPARAWAVTDPSRRS